MRTKRRPAVKKPDMIVDKASTPTYLTGIMMAVNAITGAYCLVDSPNCCYKKVEYIEKNHDLFSSFFDSDGHHRVAHTDATTQALVNDRVPQVEALLGRLSAYEKAQVVLLCSLPSASITGIQYDLIVRKVQEHSPVPVLALPSKNMQYDWLEGYADVLLALAQKLELSSSCRKKDHVGIVGYAMERNEGDHVGNILELTRFLRALSLEPVSVWLQGEGLAQLSDIQYAETIISLPYGRSAAREIAKRTGARLLELDLPFGLHGTTRWLRALGDAFGKAQEAEQLIQKELSTVMPVLEWLIPTFISDRAFSLCLDPYLGKAVHDALRECGGTVTTLRVFGVPLSSPDIFRGMTCTVVQDPPIKDLLTEPDAGADIGIGNSLGKELFRGRPYLQFGFPTPGHHCLDVRPFMGYKGFVAFVNTLLDLINAGLVVKP